MTRGWLKAVSAAGAAFAVGAVAGTERGCRVDRLVFDLLNRDRGPAADAFFGGVTELGSIAASAAAAAVLAASGRRRAAASALGAASAMWVVGQVAKGAYKRPRPGDRPPGSRLLIARPNGSSWPSSHPAVLLAFVTVAGRELGIGARGRLALSMLAGTVALSRVYVGVHYPSDAVGGMLLGRAVAEAWPSRVSPLQ